MTKGNAEPWWVQEAKASMAAFQRLSDEEKARQRVIALLDSIIEKLGGEPDADGR